MIPAIPTVYKGVQFRSRLEARYAVFFDMLKIDWEYEPIKVVLRTGIGYIPDFKLNVDFPNTWHVEHWFEVKPDLAFVQPEKSNYAVDGIYHQRDPGAGNTTTARYFIATQEFRFFRYNEIGNDFSGMQEYFFRITKKGQMMFGRPIPQYGIGFWDISSAVNAARNYKFD